MTIGGSIALIIIGAILRFAVTWTPNGIDLQVVGDILMAGGVIGLIISLSFLIARRRRATSTQVYEERRYTEPPGGGYGGSAGGGSAGGGYTPASGPLSRLIGVRARARGARAACDKVAAWASCHLGSPGAGGTPMRSSRPGSTWSPTSRCCPPGRRPGWTPASWELRITTETGQVHRWDWAAFRALPAEEHHRRHPLRDQMVQARHPLAGGVAGHAAGRRRDQRRVRGGALLRRLHHQPAAGGPARRPGLDRLRATTASRSRPSTAARPGCWCRTCTSGSRPSGSAASTCSTRTSRGSGRASATTTTETHGASSGTGATDLAGRAPSAALRDETATARTIVLDVPGWPGHLPGQHVDVRLTAAGRLLGPAVATRSPRAPGRRPGRADRRAARRRRGLALPHEVLAVGDPLELRGPVGGWFVWRPGRPRAAGAAGRPAAAAWCR